MKSKTNPVLFSTRKLWTSRTTPLRFVEDGSSEASTLFCMPGQKVLVSRLAGYANAADYFPSLKEISNTDIGKEKKETTPEVKKGNVKKKHASSIF